MLCGYQRLAGLLSLGLLACSSIGPTTGSDPRGADQEDIVGGQNDSTHKAVFGIVINGQSLCSGTLLAPNLVLTARHCVSDLSTGDGAINCNQTNFLPTYAASSFVLSYAADLTGTVAQNSIFEVSDVRVPTSAQLCGNDIALLILSSNVPAASVTPIPPRVDQAPQAAETFTAVGYGLTNPQDSAGTTAGIRRMLGGESVDCVGAADCGPPTKDDEWAANASVCHGDSGGPAIDAQGRVIGVASRADTYCAFSLYSSVSPWQSLIVSTAVDAADAGGYAPPDWTGATEPTDGGTPTGGTGGSSGGTGGASSGGMGGTSTGGRASATGGASGRASGTAGSASASGGRASTAGAPGNGGSTSSAGRTSNGGTTSRGGASTGGTTSSGGTTSNGGRDTTGGTAGLAMQTPPDAGTTPPDAGNDASGPVKPLPELGEECTDNCFGTARCYTTNGKIGVCVEGCSADDKSCPVDSKCNVSLAACVPNAAPASDSKTTESASCGCRIGDDRSANASVWPTLGLLAFCGGMLRRKRRS